MVPGKMPFVNASSYSIMMVLSWWEEDGSLVHDNTKDFLFLLVLKALLNILILTTYSCRLNHSLMGTCVGSLALADFILLFAEAYTWIFSQHTDYSIPPCFTLTHASTIYSILPLPMMLLGAIDYITHWQRLSTIPMSPGRAISSYLLVLLIWALACGFSYNKTITEVTEVRYNRVYTALLCPVHESAVVTYSCTALSLAVSCTLLFFWRDVSVCLRNALRSNMLRSCKPAVAQSDLPFRFTKGQQDREKGVVDAHAYWQQGEKQGPEKRSSVLLSLMLGFSLTWMPFLQVSVVCWLLGFSAPSYMTVNLLWLLCINSLLTGTVCWSQSTQLGVCAELLDDTYSWSLQGHPPQNIYTLTGEAKEGLLQV